MLGADPQWKVLLDRRADHRRRRNRPVDQKGIGVIMAERTHSYRPRPRQALRPRHRPRQCRFRSLSGRNPRRHRRQRRRQVLADQGDFRRRHPDEGEIRLEGKPVQLQVADGGARGRHRDRLPEPRAVAGAVDRRQHVPRPRDPQTGLHGQRASACSTGRRWKRSPATSSPNSA